MGKAQAQPVYPRGLDFEQVWAALMETDRIVKESAQEVREAQKQTARRQEEIDRILKETARRQEETALQMKETARRQEETTDRQMKEVARRQEETDRILKETARRQEETARRQEETDRQMKEYNKRFSEFTNRFGEVVEYMIAPNLREKFWEIGLKFHQANTNAAFSDDTKVILFEVDVLLQNGDKAMLVEVKTKLTTEDVKEHVKRLEKMRAYADLHGDKRVFLGAVAGVVMTANVKKYALGQGFYVIEPSGETFNITPPNGQPKEW